MTDADKILVGKPELKRTFERTRRIWKDNIKVDLEEIVLENVVWIHLAERTGGGFL
jgi:hypothetical protein